MAILVASTVVLVTSLRPTQPGIKDPRTHERTATEAQDILDALAAESVPRCTELPVEGADGEVVLREVCPGGERLDHAIVADLLGNTTGTCDEIRALVGPGKRVAVVLHGSIREKVLCGDLPPIDEPTASQAAFATTVLRFNYTHVFTDLDRYNGNDPSANGQQITSDGDVHTEEARAWQRVTTVPTRMSWPVVPKGEGLQAEVVVQGRAVGGNRTLEAAGFTEASASRDLEYASFYGEQIPWCPEGWDPSNDTCVGDPAPSLEDDATFDWKLDGRSFPPEGVDPDTSNYRSDVTFEVRVNETAGAQIDPGNRLVCKIPPDWELTEPGITVSSEFEDTESSPSLSGSRSSGWTLIARTDTPINATNTSLQITATPPNPSNLDASDDPARPVYVFRCWLEGDAHSVLDIPVDLRPSDVGDLPITSGVIATVSPANGMDTDGEGWWGVSVINPTSESLGVRKVRVSSLREEAIFRKLNHSVGRPEGLWEVVGLQGSEEKIRNGHFEQGGGVGTLTATGIPEWSRETWAPDPGRPTSAATDSRGLPHLVYSRARDGRLVHVWQERTEEGRPDWSRELLDFHGWVFPRSVVIDDRGTPDRTGDDRLLVFTVGPEDKNPDPEGYEEDGDSSPYHTSGLPGFDDSGSDEDPEHEVIRLSKPIDGTWDAEHLAQVGAVSSMSARLGNGTWWLAYTAWEDGDGRLLLQRNVTGSSTCGGVEEVSWHCETLVSEGDPSQVSTVWKGSSLGVLYREHSLAESVGFCVYPCDDPVTIGEARAGNTTASLTVGANGTLHAAWAPNGSAGIQYGFRPERCPSSRSGCWTNETAVGSTDGPVTSLGIGTVANGTRPEIAYTTGGGGIHRSRRTGEDGRCKEGALGWACGTVEAEAATALSAHDGGRGTVHLGYVAGQGSGQPKLRYASSRMGVGSWSFWPGAFSERGSAEVGGSINADVDGSGTVHVVYQDESTSSLRYARTTGDGSWSTETVHTGPPWAGWRSDVTTVGGEPVIAYYTRTALWVAEPADTDGNCGIDGDWECRRIAPIGFEKAKLADVTIDTFDEDGSVAILYHDPTRSLSVAFDGKPVTLDRCDAIKEWQCLGVPDSSEAADPDAVVHDGKVHMVWQVSDRVHYANASDQLTSDYTVGPTEAFDERDPSGIASQIAAGTLDGSERLWVMEATNRYAGLSLTTEDTPPCCDDDDGDYGGSGEHDHAYDIRIATKPAGGSTSLSSYDTGSDQCVDGDDHPNWACQSVAYTDAIGGRGDLVFADGELHGVFGHGPIHHVTTAGSGCPQDDDLGCTAIASTSGALQPGEATYAIVVRNGTPWIFFEQDPDRTLQVAKAVDGDQDCPRAPTWNCEVVDPGHGVATSGLDPAVAVDRVGRPHVTHYDPGDRDLLYSVRTGTDWSTETVDTGAAPVGTGSDVAADRDAGGDLHLFHAVRGKDADRYVTDASGSWTSIPLFTGVLDRDLHVADDTVHLLFGAENARLVHAWCGNASQGACTATSSWTWENVTACTGRCRNVDVETLPNGTLQIKFETGSDVYTGTRVPGRNSTCGANSTEGWRCQVPPIASAWNVEMGVGPGGQVGLAFVNTTNHKHGTDAIGQMSKHYKLWFTEETRDGFSTPTLVAMHDAGTAGTDKELDHELSVAYTAAGEPRVAYGTDPTAGFDDVRVAMRRNGAWSNSTVETRSEAFPGYHHPTLVIVDGDRTGLVYARDIPSTLRVALETPGEACSGGELGWSCETLRDLSSVRTIPDARWQDDVLSTVLGPTSSDPALAFSNATGSWVAEAVPTEHGRTSGDVGYYSDVALERSTTDAGRVEPVPHVAFYDAGNGSAKHATKADGEWVVETVDATGDAGLFASVAVGEDGPMLAYWDRLNGDLRFARRIDGTWRTERVNGTGDVASTGFVDLRIDPAGLPTIVHQVDTGSGRALGLAKRDSPNGSSCGPGTDANWSCTILDEVTGSPTGIWSSLAIDTGQAASGHHSVLHRRIGTTGPDPVRLTNSSSGLTGCSGDDNWTCADLYAGGDGPAYPSHDVDAFGGHLGLLLEPVTSLDPSQDTDRFPGGREPVPSDVVEATDRADPGLEPCTADGWRCRTVLSERRVARPDVRMVDEKAHAVLEEATKRTFLYGTNRDWSTATVVGGIGVSVVEQRVGDGALRLERTFDDRTWDHETEALHQTFAVPADRNVSAAVLQLNWSKAIEGDGGDLALDAFDLRISIDPLGPDAGPPAVVWSQSARRGYGTSTFTQIPVTEIVDEPGSYRFQIVLETRGKMLSSGSSATVEATLDEVSLRTFEDKVLPLTNGRFDARSDRLSTVDEGEEVPLEPASDGNWTVAEDDTPDTYDPDGDDEDKAFWLTRIWREDEEPTAGGATVEADPHAAFEYVCRPLQRDRTIGAEAVCNPEGNALRQEFEIRRVDGELPTSVGLSASLYTFAKVMETSWEHDCWPVEHPKEDPCSIWYPASGGVDLPIKEYTQLSDSTERLGVWANLTYLDNASTPTTTSYARSIPLDPSLTSPDDCREACNMEQYVYAFQEAVSSFVQDHGAGRYRLTFGIHVRMGTAPLHDTEDETPAWRSMPVPQVAVGVDNVLLDADYGGGTTVQWTGFETVPERTSRDWVFRVFGNERDTFASGDRVRVDADYSNGYGTEALHMPGYGIYRADVRPENATCVVGCEGHGGGYDIEASACVTAGVGAARAAAKGRACYENDPNAFLTRGIEQALRDKSVAEIVGGDDLFDTFAARDPDGTCNHARVHWNFTKVEEAYRQSASEVDDVSLDEVGNVELTLHSPAYGAPVWTADHGSLSGTDRIPLCDLFFEGAHVLEAELPIAVESGVDDPGGNGTKVNVQTARKVDYLTVVPRDREGEDRLGRGLPAVGVELRTWWRSG